MPSWNANFQSQQNPLFFPDCGSPALPCRVGDMDIFWSHTIHLSVWLCIARDVKIPLILQSWFCIKMTKQPPTSECSCNSAIKLGNSLENLKSMSCRQIWSFWAGVLLLCILQDNCMQICFQEAWLTLPKRIMLILNSSRIILKRKT